MSSEYEFESDDEREYWEERSAIVASGMNWPMDRAEKVAWDMVMDRRLKRAKVPTDE